MNKETLHLAFSVGLSYGMGDRARFPLEFRRKRLITAIVVADTKETKPQSISRLRFSFAVPIRDGRMKS